MTRYRGWTATPQPRRKDGKGGNRLSNPGSITTQQELESYGEEFGVKHHEVTVSCVDGNHNKAPFKGTFSRRDLSVGCGMLANDLVALRSERVQSTAIGQFIVRQPSQVGEVRVGNSKLRTVLLRPQSPLLVAMTSGPPHPKRSPLEATGNNCALSINYCGIDIGSRYKRRLSFPASPVQRCKR